MSGPVKKGRVSIADPRGARQFRTGDLVRTGLHVATVTDVGTVLVAITTAMGASRMVCPWELVRLRAAERDHGSALADSRTMS